MVGNQIKSFSTFGEKTQKQYKIIKINNLVNDKMNILLKIESLPSK